MSSQLAKLAVPFPKSLVHSNPSGRGSYVGHDVVTQKLLMVLGPYDVELVQIIRGDVAGIEPDPKGTSERAKKGAPALTGVVCGVVMRLSVVCDGIPWHVEETGDCEDPHNWRHDGARMKDAMSDAIKRCAMRMGVALHVWAQDEFILDPQKLDAVIARRTGSPLPMGGEEMEPSGSLEPAMGESTAGTAGSPKSGAAA